MHIRDSVRLLPLSGQGRCFVPDTAAFTILDVEVHNMHFISEYENIPQIFKY